MTDLERELLEAIRLAQPKLHAILQRGTVDRRDWENVNELLGLFARVSGGGR